MYDIEYRYVFALFSFSITGSRDCAGLKYLLFYPINTKVIKKIRKKYFLQAYTEDQIMVI